MENHESAKPDFSELTKEVWGLLLRLLHQQRPGKFLDASAEIGLTMGQARALLLMPSEEPIPMRELAGRCGSDPSHITRLIDQLEEKQLVERRPSPGDRRVKALMLTETGTELKKRLHDKLTEAPVVLEQLKPEELLLLRDVFQRLVEPREG